MDFRSAWEKRVEHFWIIPFVEENPFIVITFTLHARKIKIKNKQIQQHDVYVFLVDLTKSKLDIWKRAKLERRRDNNPEWNK